MDAFAGIRPNFQRGSKPDPPSFIPGVCSGGYLFSIGVQPPQPPANFYPGRGQHNLLNLCSSIGLIDI